MVLEIWRKDSTATIFQLRTAHCQVLPHLWPLKISILNECRHRMGIKDMEHILQHCPFHTINRSCSSRPMQQTCQKTCGEQNAVYKEPTSSGTYILRADQGDGNL